MSKLRQLLKAFLSGPADALLASSRTLPQRIHHHPSLAAKFFPYKARASSYVVPRPPPGEGRRGDADLPVPPPEMFLGSAGTPEEFLAWGRRDWEKMRDILRDSGFDLAAGQRVLDFGCATGRIVRWFRDLAETGEVWGVDVFAECILWCQQHLGPPFRFVTTTTFPHLPFGDDYFDLIYAGSVFTHIADLADAWLLELRRILRPGGRLYVTVHDQHTLEVWNAYARELAKEEILARIAASGFLDSPWAMFTINRTPGPGLPGEAQVFYDLDYLRHHWGQFLKVRSVTPWAYFGQQTALLLEKPL